MTLTNNILEVASSGHMGEMSDILGYSRGIVRDSDRIAKLLELLLEVSQSVFIRP